MANADYDTVRAFVLDQIKDNIAKVGKTASDISDDTDLLQSGILDSFDFLDLIGAIEDETDWTVDLGEMGTDNIAQLGGFVQGIVSQNS